MLDKCQIVHYHDIYPLSTHLCTNMLPPSVGTLAQICWIVNCCNCCQAVIQKMEPDSHMFSGRFSKIYVEHDSHMFSGRFSKIYMEPDSHMFSGRFSKIYREPDSHSSPKVWEPTKYHSTELLVLCRLFYETIWFFQAFWEKPELEVLSFWKFSKMETGSSLVSRLF